MKTTIYLVFVIAMAFAGCNQANNSSNEAVKNDTVRNSEEMKENSAYDLPGEDTAAIHQNTTHPGELEKK